MKLFIAEKRKTTFIRSPFFFAVILSRKLRSKLAWTWLNQYTAIRENNCRHASVATIYTLHILGCSIILFNVNGFICYAMGVKPSLRHAAITTPRSNIHLYCLFVCRELLHKILLIIIQIRSVPT